VQFDESHFDESNVIAHFRTKDRTTSDGKKVFYIEEIQSDWGQQFRKGGSNSYEIKVSNSMRANETEKALNQFTIGRGQNADGSLKDNNYFDWYKNTQRRLQNVEPDYAVRDSVMSPGLYREF